MSEYKQIRLNPDVREELDSYKMDGESYSIAIRRLFKEYDLFKAFYNNEQNKKEMIKQSKISPLGMNFNMGDFYVPFNDFWNEVEVLSRNVIVKMEDEDFIVFYPEDEVLIPIDLNEVIEDTSRIFDIHGDAQILFNKENGYRYGIPKVNGEYVIKRDDNAIDFMLIIEIMMFKGYLNPKSDREREEFLDLEDIHFKSANLGDIKIIHEYKNNTVYVNFQDLNNEK